MPDLLEMDLIDESRDEIRLSKFILDRLEGRFRLVGTPLHNGVAALPVDVIATNEALVMEGRALGQFTHVLPGNAAVIAGDGVCDSSGEIAPSAVALVLLCGGLSFRSRGEIHPLRILIDPNGARTTLLDRQLDRIAQSTFSESTCFIVGTPLNELALKTHLVELPPDRRPQLYTGGLAPRLLANQRNLGSPTVMRDSFGRISYNPIGHLEALRWFVLSGALAEVAESDVAILISYSNWGKLFTGRTLDFANVLKKLALTDPNLLFLVEVVPRSHEKKTGSMLVAPSDDPADLKLVKYGYAHGHPTLTADRDILMSTNTWHVSIPNLLGRLQKSTQLLGLANERAALLDVLKDTAGGRRRDELSNAFEGALPTAPQLIPTSVDGRLSFLRVERDLDQLSLIRGSPVMKALQVTADRSVSLKVPADFEDPAKRKLLFGS
jgi:hypothetical protein